MNHRHSNCPGSQFLCRNKGDIYIDPERAKHIKNNGGAAKKERMSLFESTYRDSEGGDIGKSRNKTSLISTEPYEEGLGISVGGG